MNPLNPSDSGQYDNYGRETPKRNRNPETAWSKKRTAKIVLSVLAIAAISAGITIGVTKSKKKSNTVQVLNFVLKKKTSQVYW